jgi:PAS domain S-box-containing protein
MASGMTLAALRRDGSEVSVEVALSPTVLDGRTVVLAALRDVTEQRRIQRRLEDSERRLRNAMQIAGLFTWELDLRTDTRTYSPELIALLGGRDSHPDSAAFYEALHPEDRATVADATKQAIATGRGYQLEVRIRRADGEWRWLETLVEVCRGADGRPERLLGVVQDTTERRRVIDELRESRAQLRAVLDAAPDFVAELDADGRFRFLNRTMPGYTPEEVVGRSMNEFLPPDQHARSDAALRVVLETGAPVTIEVAGEGTAGPRTTYSTRLGPVMREGRVAGVVLVSRDVTELKQTEAQLVASDRMAAVGSLAAGVAHEINNPLAAIVAGLELLERRHGEGTSADGTLREELRDMRVAAWRIRDIVRDLRVFARADEEPTGAVDLRNVLTATLRMARTEIRHRARLVTDFQPVPLVAASESRLGQVFLNLVVNAAQAIPDGDAEHNEIRVSTRLDSQHRAVVEIADTGCGMTPDVLTRIFTPFFTTKPAAVGTGLGLPICQRIVAELGGEIGVESTPRKGSVFRVHLPAAPPGMTTLEPPRTRRATAARRARVLVVDDDHLVGRSLQRLLTPEHDVLFVAGGREALAALAQEPPFDAVLCDLMMPEMSGAELFAEVRERQPEVCARFVFMTGGPFTPGAREFLDSVPNTCLEKPLTEHDLRAAIGELIG